MTGFTRVSDLRAQLEALPDHLPVHAYDESTGDIFPILLVDGSMSDRIDLNFSSQEDNTYRVNVTVYHSFTVEAPNEEVAHYEASENVLWDDHIKDCSITIEQEKDDDTQ